LAGHLADDAAATAEAAEQVFRVAERQTAQRRIILAATGHGYRYPSGLDLVAVPDGPPQPYHHHQRPNRHGQGQSKVEEPVPPKVGAGVGVRRVQDIVQVTGNDQEYEDSKGQSKRMCRYFGMVSAILILTTCRAGVAVWICVWIPEVVGHPGEVRSHQDLSQ